MIDRNIIKDVATSLHSHQLITNNIFSYFESNIKTEALYIIQQYLKDEGNLTFYTDRLLINTNTQAALITASFIQILDMNNITYTFTLTIENWPSFFRTELFAILLTLIV
ncbi:hypothetical protein RCL_jg951.t1 [Rhizophagus clarus]|uniref:Uncharacterized protein n=1 Tax=Rhizophagus clarus TaxID=94130 RepID=A0A8H3MEN1_9GLOM|nr:hypothetical protein RCL_jg951.t1 [Rhizophagus clarus]